MRLVARALVLVAMSLVLAGTAAGGSGPPARVLFQTVPQFSSDAPYGLGVANADGTAFIDLTADMVRAGRAALDPAWSPDGSRVAFSLYRTTVGASPSSAEIVVENADGTGLRQLTHDSAEHVSNEGPVWSPGGREIAWTKRVATGSDIWLMDSDGGSQRAITGDGQSAVENSAVSWSSDGTALAWLKRPSHAGAPAADGNVWLANADGSGARPVTTTSHVIRGPSWQPGGPLLLYGEGVGTTTLRLVDPAVGPPGVAIPSPGYAYGAYRAYGADPAWSTAGDRIAWGGRDGVQVATVTGSVHRVAGMDADNVTWSPDGSKLAFVHEQMLQDGRSVCGCPSVYVVDAAGGTPRIVSGREGVTDVGWYDPVWWPDSARLSVGGQFGVRNVNADGTCLRSFPNGTSTAISAPLLWQPGARSLPPVTQCVTLETIGGFMVETAPVGRPPNVTVTVANRGNATANEVTVLVIPSSGELTSSMPGCRGGTVLRCALGSVGGLSSTAIPVDVSSAKPGRFMLQYITSAAEEPQIAGKTLVQLLPCATVGGDASQHTVGTAGRDTICGFGGDDLINALGGDDWIDAGTGYDTVYGGAGNDVIFGQLGHDHLYGGPGNDSIDGGNGPDVIAGGPGNDHLAGGLYPDVLLGGPGNDVIHADHGYADRIDCGPGYDTVYAYRDVPDRLKNCERVIRR